MKIRKNSVLQLTAISVAILALSGCFPSQEKSAESAAEPMPEKVVNQQEVNQQQGKPVVYQVFTRLFGNQNKTNKAWGTLEENGVGKFSDFTDEALQGIKEFGTTHVWYTGIPHHAVITDYTKYGISNDDPDVVKGRAGSPYAVKDYYSVNPDLADDPAKRLEEFKALIDRTHKNDLKVIIDIVPNHVARHYESLAKPDGVEDFGASDDTSVEYKRDNNFYYVVGESFKVPEPLNNYQPLGGDTNPLSDQKFDEVPAKWTGNGSRLSQPNFNDWYETVKVNYGVKPDGTYDFATLPEEYRTKSHQEHLEFWKDKTIPDSWNKFRDIALYWTNMGVDGFRFDMAEMVPVEFWSYLNSSIKQANPDAFLLAEIYNPKAYRNYIQLGKMDYLYDKVDLYDNLKWIMQGKQPASTISPIIEKFADIDQNLLHFLENHDEQRIASADFAGDAEKGKPAMVVSALVNNAATMLYFAQALGEPGDGDAGFGDPTRTTIFDYWGIDSLQRWNNDGKFDGAQLTDTEKALREFYVKLLSYSATSSAVKGEFFDVNADNLAKNANYPSTAYAFARWSDDEKIVVLTNFSATDKHELNLILSEELIKQWQLAGGEYTLTDVLSAATYTLKVSNGVGQINATLDTLESLVLAVK